MRAIMRKKHKIKRNDLVFYIVFMAIPILHFAIFYVGVNINSLLLTFQKINITADSVTWTLWGNLGAAIKEMFRMTVWRTAAQVSVLGWLLLLVIGTPLALLFSYYIYKRMPLSGVFRVLLFMPSIISAIVMVTIFQQFVEQFVPEIWQKAFGKTIPGLIENTNARFATIMFYNIWVSFGVNVLMYVNAMNAIPPEQEEAAKLDGCVGIREFIHITLPAVWSTFATFVVVGIAGIFTSQLNLFSFFGGEAPSNLGTFGYWLYVRTQGAASRAEYPILSAMGVWMTLVAVPLTLLARWALDRFGPTAEPRVKKRKKGGAAC